MTHYESAIDDIATRLQGVDASLTTSIADILAAAIQELIEAELTGTIGADHGERTPARTAQRNGHRPKLLSTPAGDIDVAIREHGCYGRCLKRAPGRRGGRAPGPVPATGGRRPVATHDHRRVLERTSRRSTMTRPSGSMRRCGDVQLADLGEPQGREAGFARPVVVVTAQLVLDQGPSVVQVVPLTSALRGYRSEVTIEPDPGNGLEVISAAQCQHIRAIAIQRLATPVGNVGPQALSPMREILAELLDV